MRLFNTKKIEFIVKKIDFKLRANRYLKKNTEKKLVLVDKNQC